MADSEKAKPQKPKSELICLPNPNLRTPSRRVGLIDQSIFNLAGRMLEQAKLWEEDRQFEMTVGLAAVQIDQLWRVVLIRHNLEKDSDPRFQVLINPKITRTDGPKIEEYEGCLSVPDYYAKVERYQRVRFEALDLAGQPIVASAEGFLARVIQHEIDHLKGIMTVDRVKEPESGFGKLSGDGQIEPVSLDEVKAKGLLEL